MFIPHQPVPIIAVRYFFSSAPSPSKPPKATVAAVDVLRKSRRVIFIRKRLLPFDCSGWFTRDIEANAVYSFNFINDPARKLLEEIAWQLDPIRGHTILGINGTNCDGIIIGSFIPHNSHTSN